MTAHDSHATDAHGAHDFAHPMPVWMLLAVFFALIFLTIVTVAQSAVLESLRDVVDLGNLEIWLSLGIATIKATLVMVFFMHMKNEKPFNVIIFLSSFFFMSLFLGFTLMDAHNYKDRIDINTAPLE
jgi:cytochrome c oxidase subunit 4